MTWTWRLEAADGSEVGPAALEAASIPGLGSAAGSQSDAESWLGENWRELQDAGVAAVSLLDAGAEVYRMSLSEQ